MPISDKQKKILAFPYSKFDAIICDGAVRSGKTSLLMFSFVEWAMREFNGQRFGICGKTVGSATENMVIPYISMHYAKKRYTLHWRRSQKILEVRRQKIIFKNSHFCEFKAQHHAKMRYRQKFQFLHSGGASFLLSPPFEPPWPRGGNNGA